MQLKGGVCPELVVYCRLFIMRGILAFHQSQKAAAGVWFAQATNRLKEFHIGDDELALLLSMGFTGKESRVALRACSRDQNAAITYLLKKREDRQRERAEEKKKQAQRRFGKTANGLPIDLDLLKSARQRGSELPPLTSRPHRY